MQVPVRAFALLRSAVLQHARIPVVSSATRMQAANWQGLRSFGDAAPGTYLDKQEVTDRVLNVVKNFPKVSGDKVNPGAHFVNDLGLDSLDTVEMVMALEEEFAIEIPDSEADKIVSCSDAIAYISAHPQAKGPGAAMTATRLRALGCRFGDAGSAAAEGRVDPVIAMWMRRADPKCANSSHLFAGFEEGRG
eukprot:jgi/Mesvir1/15617/Mv03224-RA.1